MFKYGGFSLVELLVAIAIIGALMAVGVPAFSIYMDNVRIRTTAEAFLSATEQARATAASRNMRVEIIFTDIVVDPNNPDQLAAANAAAAAAVGTAATAPTGWLVRTTDPPITFIEGKNSLEGGRGTQSVVNVGRGVGGITFTPLGGTTLAANAVISFTKINPTNNPNDACIADAPPGPVRCLNVVVSTTGRVKLCDPDPAIIASDTRACPP